MLADQSFLSEVTVQPDDDLVLHVVQMRRPDAVGFVAADWCLNENPAPWPAAFFTNPDCPKAESDSRFPGLVADSIRGFRGCGGLGGRLAAEGDAGRLHCTVGEPRGPPDE